MKIILENDIEKKSIDDKKLSKIKEIIGRDINIDLIQAGIFFQDVDRLSWQMGQRQFHNRDELYDR